VKIYSCVFEHIEDSFGKKYITAPLIVVLANSLTELRKLIKST